MQGNGNSQQKQGRQRTSICAANNNIAGKKQTFVANGSLGKCMFPEPTIDKQTEDKKNSGRIITISKWGNETGFFAESYWFKIGLDFLLNSERTPSPGGSGLVLLRIHGEFTHYLCCP